MRSYFERAAAGWRRLPPWAAVAAIGLLGLGVRLAVVSQLRFPFLFEDTMYYWVYAHQIQKGQWALHLFGVLQHYPDYLFPLFLALVIAPFRGAEAQFLAAQLAGSAAISLVAWPAYGLARDLGAPHRAALAAAALAELMPGMDYGTAVMAEAIYVPLCAWALWRVWSSSRSGGARAGALAGLAAGLTALAKPQGLLLLPLAALAYGAGGRRSLGAALGFGAACLGLLGTRVLLAAHEGYAAPWSPAAFLGYYARQAPAPWLPAHAVGLFLAVAGAYALLLVLAGGGVPVAAVLDRGARVDRRFAALTLLAATALILVFARNTVLYDVLGYGNLIHEPKVRAEERYLFPVLPLFFAWWAAKIGGAWGGVSPRMALMVPAFAAFGWAAQRALHPFLGFLVTFDAPSLSIPYTLAAELGHRDAIPMLLFWGGAAAVFGAGACLRRPSLVAAGLLLLSLSWPAAVLQTSSLTNWQVAARIIPWMRRALPADAVVVCDGSAVDSGVANDVQFFLLRPWRFIFPQGPARYPYRPRHWVFTTADHAVPGALVKDGYALIPPRALARVASTD